MKISVIFLSILLGAFWNNTCNAQMVSGGLMAYTNEDEIHKLFPQYNYNDKLLIYNSRPLMWYVWHIDRKGSDQGDAGLFADEKVVTALRKIGTNAVPRLIQELSQTERSRETEYRRENAAFALGIIGTNAVSAIPALLKSLNDIGDWVAPIAIQSLGKIHGDPKTVIPILTSMVNARERFTNQRSGYARHQMAVIALGNYGAEAKSAIPTLLVTLKDPNELFRKQALDAIKQIDPDTAKNLKAN